jgi:hypothetical protein
VKTRASPYGRLDTEPKVVAATVARDLEPLDAAVTRLEVRARGDAEVRQARRRCGYGKTVIGILCRWPWTRTPRIQSWWRRICNVTAIVIDHLSWPRRTIL